MRIAFLTNILTPYRISFYDEMYRQLQKRDSQMRVFAMTDSLPLRPWVYNDLKRDYTRLLPGKKIFIGGNDYLFNSTVIKEVNEYNPDVIVIAGSWTYPTFCMVAFSRKLRESCIRLLWTESHNHTGINNNSKTNKIVQWIKKLVIEKFDGYCIPSRYAKETIGEIVALDNKVIVSLPNLVDSKFYNETNNLRNKGVSDLRNARGIPLNRFVFICPARFVSLKGIVPFISNVANAKGIDNATFVFVGGGPEKTKIEEAAKQNRVDIRLYDYQTQEDVREWLALADAFLLPSLSDANPLSSIEAAWAGLPLCLSCYVGNNPELVDNEINGVVFDTLNPTSVCKQIGFIMNQPKEWYLNARLISNWKAKKDFEIVSETKRLILDLEKIGSGE